MIEGNQPQEIEPEEQGTEMPEDTLAEAKAKADDYLANWQRTQADFANYKRRNDQGREQASKFANSVLILALLPALDDLERALSSVPKHLAKLPWVDGIRLIERKFRAGLEAQGLTAIKAKGKPFDPNLHEAAMHSPGKEGIVVRELQRGYRLYDRVLRPSKVVVGSGRKAELPGED
jgi:molecular chaperone GrpE